MSHAPRTRWDPAQYQRHSGHRGRPLLDLLVRVPPLPSPAAPRVADLGCGPGRPSLPLTERWPDAHVTGYDNSPAMLAEAAAHAGPTPGGGSLDFAHADLVDWRPTEPFDLILSNAALQWVPDHADRFPSWVAGLTPGGVFAFQVPGNFSAPSHVLMRELCESPRWRGRLGGVPPHPDMVLTPEAYVGILAGLGCAPDVWETTYLHVLRGEDPVLDWVSGTGLRPVLTALEGDPEAREAFLAEYRGALRAAYPPGGHGTLFPFRRVFVVAQRTEAR
ncbi:trans-aconitate 2-methyltransferase [Streptomyces sp. NBC_01803]|uniref:trans-aconitate 2-methyltransferase n=1 Tax=Streptomyces sp. NBC_01803 TaxID=2975946 RepID=UPI002DDA6D34|nr:trans-aconitate 2-methyltransferase [Streptomyces sp. NBC_01803]WSA44595.1 trans-aconitate 2-methyltransferase [Streptomyces sp. NBC_01803]